MQSPPRRLIATLLTCTIVATSALTGGAGAAPTFTLRTKLPGGTGFEPGVDIGPTGTIYVNEPPGLSVHSHLWRSTGFDASGRPTFEKIVFPAPFNRFPGGGDSDVDVSAAGRVYFLDLWVGSNSLARSDDGGTTWAEGTPITTLPPSDRQWIVVGKTDPSTGEDTVFAVSHEIFLPGLLVARSRDSGLTWTHHSVPSISEGGSTGSAVANNQGFVAFTHADGIQRLAVYRSTNDAETWTKTFVQPNPNVVVRDLQGLAIDGNTLHTIWTEDTDYAVHYSRSTNLGATWSSPVTISAPGSNVYPWVAARNGKVAIAWYSAATTQVSAPDDVPAGTTWYVNYAESIDGGTTFSSPVVTDPASVKSGVICTEGFGCDGNRQLGDFMQVAIDLSGKSILAYGRVTAPAGTHVVKQTA